MKEIIQFLFGESPTLKAYLWDSRFYTRRGTSIFQMFFWLYSIN